MASTNTRAALGLSEDLGPPRAGSLLRAEFAAAFGLRHLFVLLVLILVGVACAFWLPLFPESVYRFFERIFRLTGWPAIVVANDLAGLVFFVYWIAIFDALAIVIVPLEEGYLDIYLAKPVTRRAYMLARLVPVLLVAGSLGVLGAGGNWLGLALAGLSYPSLAYAGAAAATVAWALCLAAFANLCLLAARETFTALLIAFAPIFAAMLPGMLFMYRPDIFEGAPLVRDITVFPMSLVWYPDIAARWGLPVSAVLLALAAIFAALAGHRLDRREA